METLVGEVAVVVLEGQRALPVKLQELGFRYQFDDLAQALEDILS
jgi:NAD dependent epimerase/dehydratase family enzyme